MNLKVTVLANEFTTCWWKCVQNIRELKIRDVRQKLVSGFDVRYHAHVRGRDTVVLRTGWLAKLARQTMHDGARITASRNCLEGLLDSERRAIRSLGSKHKESHIGLRIVADTNWVQIVGTHSEWDRHFDDDVLRHENSMASFSELVILTDRSRQWPNWLVSS